ncbi:hypothetical protein BC827DRAFT_1267969 [Russula dissimulans]|nr:hypothetical protein BC827DRAFT_1267969 [Russula dissimulans]
MASPSHLSTQVCLFAGRFLSWNPSFARHGSPAFSAGLTPKIVIYTDESVDPDDIFRGDRHSTLQTPDSGSAASQKSFSTVSSGLISLAGGRFGVLATRLERAITRWARNNWADSSSTHSSTSSDSTRSSFRTANKSKSSRRKRRPPSLKDLQQREQSERMVAARMRAREIARRAIPREFNFYCPPLYPPQDATAIEEEQQFVRASSLDVILPHLDHVLRKSGKTRRPRQRGRPPRVELDHPHRSHRHRHSRGHSAKDEEEARNLNASRPDTLEVPLPTVAKGKDKVPNIEPLPYPLQSALTYPVAGKSPQGWWLDVASPSWEDMKTLGRLLHLHPLTLEDILQQEPHEKLELFPKLGYYFIVFRAVEYSTPQVPLDGASQKTGLSQLSVQGVANEICIYLVVFRDGICTFHFSNISEHLDRVRGKLQTVAQPDRRSSAWIAHGILDSVVDSFFPFVEEIGEHVMAIENAVYNEDSPASTITPIPSTNARAVRILPVGVANPLSNSRPLLDLTALEKSISVSSFIDEKRVFSRDVASIKTVKTKFLLPRLTCGLMLRRLRRAFSGLIGFCKRDKPSKIEPSFSRATLGLHRIARTRQLATSVARVMATKPEVVAAIRKRLLASDGPTASGDAEVAIYFGDVQDHILTLQQSLAHYERMLSESHPIYLQSLRIDLLRSQAKGNNATFMLSVVTVVVVPASVIIGVESMNVTVLHNYLDHGKLTGFAVVMVIVLFVQSLVLLLIRYWWVKAKRRRGAALE